MPEPVFGGLDEVGYGALAGPYISAIAVFRPKDLQFLPSGITDSKKLTFDKLEALYEPIIAACFDIGIGHAWPWEIDLMGPANALQRSYKRAIEDLQVARPSILYVDGDRRVDSWKGSQIVEPKADLKYIYVSAAAIVAKVWRDRMMMQLHKKHPRYRWAENKGYGSAEHEAAIKKYGLLVSTEGNTEEYIHRRRYCRKFLNP